MALSSSGIFSTSFLSPKTLPTTKPQLPPVGSVTTSHSVNLKVVGVRAVASSSSSSSFSTGKAREPRGIMRPRPVSAEMADLVGSNEISRTQALKLIWAHIKLHNLQDPNNKKVIICDEKLKRIFGGRDNVGFLEIAGLISPHFLK